MVYWLNLFTGTTWQEFRQAGCNISGHREKRRVTCSRVKPGDIFICYLTGVMRWVGSLKVLGPSLDRSPIWKDDSFPVRFAVKPLVILDPEDGIPMDDLLGRVDFFRSEKDRGGFKGFLRSSPNEFKQPKDAELILQLLSEAEKNPVSRPVDIRKLTRRPVFTVVRREGKKQIKAQVTIPEPEPEIAEPHSTPEAITEKEGTKHTEIQYRLLKLGADLGLQVWVARNDRSKIWNGQQLGSLPGQVAALPTQFNEATNRTIELIDVLWLKRNSIVAAFEVESTTSVYSGLLRMSDLLALQPNLTIKFYLVAPDERRGKVAQEICRPTFAVRERPLPKLCGFIPFSKLCMYTDGIAQLGLAGSLQPTFLNQVTEYFGTEDQEDS